MAGAEKFLWYLNFIVTVALVFRLIHCGVYRVYRFLFLYWLAQVVGDLAMFRAALGTDLYTYLYYSFISIYLILAVCVVQELYRLALAEHPALAIFGRRSVLSVTGFAAILAVLGVALDSRVLAGQYRVVHRFLTVERTIDFTILLFLLLISGFFLWFPVKVRRNIAVYITGFVLYYSFRTFGLLLTNLLPQRYLQSISTVLEGLTLICLLIWVVGIRRDGEYVTTVTGHRWNAAAAERLSLQLDEINTALTRFVRN